MMPVCDKRPSPMGGQGTLVPTYTTATGDGFKEEGGGKGPCRSKCSVRLRPRHRKHRQTLSAWFDYEGMACYDLPPRSKPDM